MHGWNSYGNAVTGHVAYDNSIRTNCNVVTDGNRPQKLSAGADVEIIADDGCLGLVDPAEPDDDPISYAAVVAESGITADYNAAEMIDHEIAADFDLARQFDSGDDLDQFKRDPIQQREHFPQ